LPLPERFSQSLRRCEPPGKPENRGEAPSPSLRSTSPRAAGRGENATHTNPAACIAAPRAPARRYCARGLKGCSLPPPATAADAHAIERAAQAAGRIAAAAALPAAHLVRAAPPQGERVAIAALLQRLLDYEALRVFDRIKLRLPVFSPAFSMADSTAKFWSFFCSASVMARLSRLAARFFAAAFLSCAGSANRIARLQKCFT